MILVDTCGWIEWLADGALADKFQPFLEDTEALLVPTVVQFELYKWLERNRGEEAAMKAIARTTRSHVVDLDTSTALLAAELSRDHGLSVADAVIYASAHRHKAELVTSDDHFEGLPGVTYFPKLREYP
ncbi:MAG: type II toxin-antitoxin system VapC family toxin [Chromatiaceae bacterium]